MTDICCFAAVQRIFGNKRIIKMYIYILAFKDFLKLFDVNTIYRFIIVDCKRYGDSSRLTRYNSRR